YARRHSGAGDHDESEPAGHEGQTEGRTGFRSQSTRRVGDSSLGAEVTPPRREDRRFWQSSARERDSDRRIREAFGTMIGLSGFTHGRRSKKDRQPLHDSHINNSN